MNSLLTKESMAGKVQMVYFDPPYGIKYNGNFQPFFNKRDVKDGKDEDLSAEPEMVKAFRDTWELGIHSYLSYMRDRLLLSRELLSDSGSIFVQISNENLHHVREILDEVFGSQNLISIITFIKRSPQPDNYLPPIADYIIWYAKDEKSLKRKYKQLYTKKNAKNDESFTTSDLTSSHEFHRTPFAFDGRTFTSGARYWSTSVEGLKNLASAGRLVISGQTLRFKRMDDDFPYQLISNVWDDVVFTSFAEPKIYAVQTSIKVLQRCINMSTDPGDLVLDITCGSGTTAYVAEQWGRRWITCDTSRVATALAKQRLMTAKFEYFELAHQEEGVHSGFTYKTVPHVTLKSIANNEPPGQETIYDQPLVDKKKVRVTGPFTVEAVPCSRVRSLTVSDGAPVNGASAGRTGATASYAEWLDELKATGVRAIGGTIMTFTRLEPLFGTQWLHAEGESNDGNRVVVCFGPEFAPLEQRQVEMALKEARSMERKPEILLFAAFQFDPEAGKDIDQVEWKGVQILKAQMSADLFSSDLRKKRSSNQSYWLIGQPDIDISEKDGKYIVSVRGFDYYNPASGSVDSHGAEKIAVWMLDTDYDDQSMLPDQVFFPMSDAKRDWTPLAKALKGAVDEELLEAYTGLTSLPFAAGEHEKIAVKLVDDRGIESLVIKNLS